MRQVDMNPDPASVARLEGIAALAKAQHHSEGSCEIDEHPVISEGDDNGAYVQAWMWVDFADTEYDKEKEKNEDATDPTVSA